MLSNETFLFSIKFFETWICLLPFAFVHLLLTEKPSQFSHSYLATSEIYPDLEVLFINPTFLIVYQKHKNTNRFLYHNLYSRLCSYPIYISLFFHKNEVLYNLLAHFLLNIRNFPHFRNRHRQLDSEIFEEFFHQVFLKMELELIGQIFHKIYLFQLYINL